MAEEPTSAGSSDFYWLKTEWIEPNAWNPNMMAPDKFEALKGYMVNGEYDAILISPSEVFYAGKGEHKRYIIIDGYWRWKAAVETEIVQVKAEIRNLTEEEAQVVAYGKGYSRGTFDPIKEAELFKLDVDRKMTAAQIAERYGAISESYVKSRLQLLKISPAVKYLYEKPVEAFKPAKVDELAHEMQSEEEKGEEPAEDLRQMAEGRVSKIVPHGTLTVSYLEAISSLPPEEQRRISLKIIEDDLTLHQTEEAVKEAKSKIKAHNRFVKALEEAVQKACPKCGSPPEDWQENPWMADSDRENNFRCSRGGCYTWWDPSVEVEGAPNRGLNAVEVAKREADLRAKSMKEGRENPAYILFEETPLELHEETVPWLLAKIKEFTYVTRVEIRGRRGDETVSLDYRAPSSAGEFGRYDLNFTLAAGLEKPYDITSLPPSKVNTAEDFKLNIEEKEYKRANSIKSKVYLTYGNGTPELRARGRRFFKEILKTGQDPFLPKDPEEIRKILETHGDVKPHD